MTRDYPLLSEIEEFKNAISDKNTDSILNMISQHPLKYFYNLKLEDRYGLNLFHIIILMDLTQMFNKVTEILIQRFNDEKKNKENGLVENNSSKDENSKMSLVDLLSIPDKEGNSPILYAAFRGNIDIVNSLINLGVSYEVKNFAGLDIIHMAAQNNKENIIVYFKEKYNFDIFKSDNEGNTSIHWASSTGGKNALDFLLFYIDEKYGNLEVINKVNDKGQNALQLTIMTNQSTSACKKLIKKGIDYNNKDINSLTVFDIVKNDKKLENIKNLLYTYTHRNCFGLNYHINDPLNKYFKLVAFIILINFLLYMVIFEFFPFLQEFTGDIKIIKLIFYLLSVPLVIGYFYMMYSDPGIIKEKINSSLLELVEKKFDIKKLCPYCMVEKKDQNCKHCFICNVCIEYFDHHCHWINNCIGNGNKMQFIAFLLVLVSNLFISCLIALKVFLLGVEKEKKIGYFMGDYYHRKFSSLTVMILILIFFWPICYILYVQTRQKKKKSAAMEETRKEVQDYYEELKQINDQNNVLNRLQIKDG